MEAITTIGLDIAKSVFQVHGIDAEGNVILRRQLKRRYVLTFFQKLPPCLVGIEACASSHHWSRELQALGHTVRLMPPAYVKPYVKRHKNDATRIPLCDLGTVLVNEFLRIGGYDGNAGKAPGGANDHLQLGGLDRRRLCARTTGPSLRHRPG